MVKKTKAKQKQNKKKTINKQQLHNVRYWKTIQLQIGDLIKKIVYSKMVITFKAC